MQIRTQIILSTATAILGFMGYANSASANPLDETLLKALPELRQLSTTNAEGFRNDPLSVSDWQRLVSIVLKIMNDPSPIVRLSASQRALISLAVESKLLSRINRVSETRPWIGLDFWLGNFPEGPVIWPHSVWEELKEQSRQGIRRETKDRSAEATFTSEFLELAETLATYLGTIRSRLSDNVIPIWFCRGPSCFGEVESILKPMLKDSGLAGRVSVRSHACVGECANTPLEIGDSDVRMSLPVLYETRGGGTLYRKSPMIISRVLFRAIAAELLPPQQKCDALLRSLVQ